MFSFNTAHMSARKKLCRFIVGFTLLFILASINSAVAQFPGGMPGGGRPGGGAQMNVGRFYGKIIDAKSNKPVDAASIQLIQNRLDTATKTRKDVVVSGQLTRSNGDFSLENLAPFGAYKLVITAIGYKVYEQKVAFEFKQGATPQQMLSMVDKDLGNIKLEPEAAVLEGVTVVGSKPTLEMAIDRKVFNVEKNLMSVGGTAEDVLRTVPSVSVDIDGNVTLRNSSPQIFVDGRPSTLTIDQIPADAIQSIELITNPSAKYDASGGTAGIINIVLKKNRRIGYNGSLRGGIDMRARINAGGDINIRQGKVNLFASGAYNQRKSISEGLTSREEYPSSGTRLIDQTNYSVSRGRFAFARFGIDYFLDNRNTFTYTQSIVNGKFNSEDEQDALNRFPSGSEQAFQSERDGFNDRFFRNFGSSLAYKHLFAKPGKEITADINYNQSKNGNEGRFFTLLSTVPSGSPLGNEVRQRQEIDGGSGFFTAQTDFVNPLGENKKLEAGARIAIRDFSSLNNNFFFNYNTNTFERDARSSNEFEYVDKVYAAYTTFSNKVNKFGYQLGLRAESSDYEGTLLNTNESFRNSFPISLFPSAFVSYKISDNSDFQVNYTRRINRPSFFQLIPFTDYVDSLNISRGNPGLRPEFTHSMELSYQKNLSKAHNVISSIYYRQTDGLISRYQFTEFSPELQRDVIINTFENANKSYSYGLEITSRNGFSKSFELTSNLNLYNAVIEGENIERGLRNEQFSYFAKINANWKLPKSYSIQLTGDYQSKTAIPVNGGGGRMGGGFMGPQASTTQGFIRPNYGVDLAFRKDFLKNNVASVTLSISDVLRTRLYDAFASSAFFIQNIDRRRDPQFFRLSFSYRFGKFDASLFKRKNIKAGMDGMQDMQM